jgi:Fur family ferric uptake transcriptional regulator
MTSQRAIILEELQKNKQHLTTAELYRIVRKKIPNISLATVYRNLELLSETGVIAKLEVSGRQKCFDSEVVAHDHVTCVQCHAIENVVLSEGKEDNPSYEGVDGYIITGRRLEFMGLCPRCQKKKEKRRETKQWVVDVRKRR